jgi:Caspase domain
VSGQRKALIVAVDEYDQEALRDLLAPAADAEALGRVLGDRQIGEFTVQVVRNEPAHVIEAHIEELFSESRSDDVLLVHFSGHGLKSESGDLFFAASNTRPNRLGSTAVSADFVQRCMRASRSRSVVVLLDCCFGGAFAQGVKVRAAGDVHVMDSFPRETRSGGGRGRAVITASNAMEFAFEGDQLGDDQHRRPSVFTSALVEGLATGDADRDEDGWVSLNELYDYVFDKVREQNPHQTPSRQVELEGELYVARSRRRRIRPAPIPPDLQAALTDPNMYTRLGAISELQSRLSSDNLPTAVGAYEALTELARTDIRYVADPAATALSQAALHPEETELHFGARGQGSTPPHRTLRLLGPPIARACAPRASDDWIRVNETAEGFDISIDTANAGMMRGTLDLKGPTGEAVIAIDVELVSSPPQEAEQAAERQVEEQARQEAEQAAERQVEEQARQEAEQAAERAAEDKARQEAEQASERAAKEDQQAESPDREQVSSAGGSQSAAETGQPVASSIARPSIRTGMAFAGVALALLAGVAGIIGTISYAPGIPGAPTFFALVASLISIGVAVAVLLLPKYRLVTIGLLQGMSWLAAAYVVYWIAYALATHLSGYTGRGLAGFVLTIISNVLATVAAVVLMVSWKPAINRRRVPMPGALPVVLLCSLGLSLIADAIFVVTEFIPHAPSYALGAAEIVVGLAVTWYAVTLRARRLGGALVLGWVINAAITLMANMTLGPIGGTGHVAIVLEFVLLATAAIIAIIYMRQPSHPESRPPHAVTRGQTIT